jgi:plastocyanin
MKIARRVLPIASAVGVLAIACSSGGSGKPPFTVAGTPVKTNAVDTPKTLKYEPALIEVSVGTTVTWTNHDIVPHTVKLLDGSNVNKPLDIGKSATITFTKAGTVYYLCSIHPQMHGEVIVTP